MPQGIASGSRDQYSLILGGFSLDIYHCKYFQTGEQMSDEHTRAVTQSILIVSMAQRT